MDNKHYISALIIDDEKLARDIVRVYLEKHPTIRLLGECSNGIDALNLIDSQAPDLIFLDVQMPDLNGFELLREIRSEKKPVVIFTTAHDQFALKAFEVNAIDYLLKPFEQSRFDGALEKAIFLIASSKQQEADAKLQNLLLDYEQWKSSAKPTTTLSRLLVKESKKAFFIKTSDIFYLEASGDYVSIHLQDKKHLIDMSLNELEHKLDQKQFIRIHRSSIVNMDVIKEMQPHFNGEFQVLLTNGTLLKLSRSYKDKLKHISGLG